MIRWAATHPTWVVGFADEVWWSREALPALHTWSPKSTPLHLVARTVPDQDPTPKALACYGILFRHQESGTADEVWLRFVQERPLSALSTQFLAWVCAGLAQQGTTALLLVWDNASWHVSKDVRSWIRSHNRSVKTTGQGVRIVICLLPIKSPWLNPIEPHWVHAKRSIVEPASLLALATIQHRVTTYFHTEPLPCLAIP